MNIGLIILIGIFIGMIYFLFVLKTKYKKSFSLRVFVALVLGIVFGGALNFLFLRSNIKLVEGITQFMSLFGDGYVGLLRMMVIPLVFISMLASITNAEKNASLGRIASKVIAILVGTVAIAALVGIATVYIFKIDSLAISEALSGSENVLARMTSLEAYNEALVSKNYVEYILSFIPKNVFSMLSGSERTSTLSTVLFAIFMGYAVLQVMKREPNKVKVFINLINDTKEVVLRMVREILKLTPYGVLAMISTFFAKTDADALGQLVKFLMASYLAIITMYVIHLGIIALVGLSPKIFAKKTWPVLLFGFSSRSSMSAVPLNISTQTDTLGVGEETASVAATFGTSIGQNGCAGIYPSMLAVMAAQIMGVQVDFAFIAQLVVITAISSFGVAGVGGGATFAAITVLSIMGLDIKIAALLISVEALIDMARTALNINDSMLAGVVTAKINKTLDVDQYNRQ